mmetsp:Transcript_7244/g.29203  ORF Transcript_7244/g.29203 Transcript_7244/m.29203 type:complete len:304 (+) Transcript_7244:356-1267(+)
MKTPFACGCMSTHKTLSVWSSNVCIASFELSDSVRRSQTLTVVSFPPVTMTCSSNALHATQCTSSACAPFANPAAFFVRVSQKNIFRSSPTEHSSRSFRGLKHTSSIVSVCPENSTRAQIDVCLASSVELNPPPTTGAPLPSFSSFPLAPPPVLASPSSQIITFSSLPPLATTSPTVDTASAYSAFSVCPRKHAVGGVYCVPSALLHALCFPPGPFASNTNTSGASVCVNSTFSFPGTHRIRFTSPGCHSAFSFFKIGDFACSSKIMCSAAATRGRTTSAWHTNIVFGVGFPLAVVPSVCSVR